MSRSAAIVAVGQTKHAAKRLDVSIAEMVREAVDACLGSKELSFADIDAVVVGNMELFEGINQPELLMVASLGAVGKPVYKMNTGGTVGASAAICAEHLVRSGLHDVVLTVGYEKQSEGETQSAITTVGDPAWERSVMAGAIGNFAVMASTYVDRSGVTPEQAAKVAVKARTNACLNPYAHLQIADITVEDVLKSRVLAAPLKLLDMCPQSDGACAVVVAGEERARQITPRPSWIVSSATAHDQQFMGDSPARIADHRSLQAASKKAYAAAGITDPRTDFDVAEIYEPATYAELAMLENLGFCAPGDGGTLIDDGVTLIDGPMPVNPSGGVLATNPVGATALIRVAEAALQVMGEAEGGHQVPEVNWALATGYGGNAWTDVMVMTGEPR
ncbi:MAG: thiolase family protein [bacterium]|nr:thiolase family protein [bacterium]